MKVALALLCLALTSSAVLSEGLPEFGSTSFSQLRQQKFPLAAPRAKAGDVISNYHLLVHAGDNSLYGYAASPTEFSEAATYWSGVLRAAGLEPGAPIFAAGMYQIPYRAPEGRVLRDFLADPRQFAPKDDASLRANMAKMVEALGLKGLSLVSAHVVGVDALLPTYHLLYLTERESNSSHENRLRILKPGDDVDFDVFRAVGLNVLQTPTTWMMVYIGPEVGYVSLVGRSAQDLIVKIANRREMFASQGKRVIAERWVPVDDAEFKFGAGLYFFQ